MEKPIKREFRYRGQWDDEFRGMRHGVIVPASTIAHKNMSMWTMDCFISGFVEWMNENLVDDCFYSTTEDTHFGASPPNSERFHFYFYFRNEQDAILFKLRWL